MTALVTVLGVLTVVLAVFVVGLLRSHARILAGLERFGAELGGGADGARTFRLAAADVRTDVAPVPGQTRHEVPDPPEIHDLPEVHDLLGVSPSGDGTAIALRSTAQLTLLAFLSSGCVTCVEFWDAFREPENQHLVGRGSLLVIVTKGPESESPSAVAELAPPHLNVVMSQQAFDDYSVSVAPYFVLVDGDESRVVGEGAAASFEQLQQLLARSLAEGGFRPGGQRSRRELLRSLRRAAASDDEPKQDR